MRQIAVSTVRERIADVVAHVAHRRERIVLTRHGHEVAVIVPMQDLERLRALDEAATESSPAVAAYRTSWRHVTDRLHRRR